MRSVAAEFPIQIELPALSQRPVSERFEMVKKLLQKEAARIGRTLFLMPLMHAERKFPYAVRWQGARVLRLHL